MKDGIAEYIGMFFVIIISYGLFVIEKIYGTSNADKVDQILSRRINKNMK